MHGMICVKHEGIPYCWNSELKRIEMYAITAVKLENCPNEVIQALMEVLGESAFIHRPGGKDA